MPKEEMSPSGFYAAVAEQFTHFGTVQFDGDGIANPTGQRLDSSITQFVIGYDINERFALQFNAPLIYRDFRRPEGFNIDEGTESGFGDISLLAKAVVWHFASAAYREFKVEEKNPIAIAYRSLPAENTIIRSSAEGEVVAMNPTFRCSGNFHLMKFLLQPAGIAGGKFDSSQRNQ
jgi:hypothetical protein